MAVAHDAASESAVSATGTSFTWSHLGGGSARGAIVFVLTVQGVTMETSVTYGGLTLSFLGKGSDTDTEPGTVSCYYLDNVSTGTQTVKVNRVSGTTSMMGMCATVTAGATTSGYTATMVTQGGSSQNVGINTSSTSIGALFAQSIDDGSPGANSVRYAACYSGISTPPTGGTDSTVLNDHDFTSFGWTMVRETTAGQGARNIGTTGASDDRAAVYIAVREQSSGAAASDPFPYFSGGYFPAEG